TAAGAASARPGAGSARRVAEFAGLAQPAAHESASDDEGRGDAGADRHETDVVDTLPGAAAPFRPAGKRDVVIDGYGELPAGTQGIGDRQIAPPDVAGQHPDAARTVDDPG